MPTYTPNTPLPGDKPSQSQAILKNNFIALNDAFDVDHIEFSETVNSGEHKKITFQDFLTADPGATNPKAKLYTREVGSFPQLFFRNENREQQITIQAPENTGVHYGIATPWGMTINWGYVVMSGTTDESNTIDFSVPFTNSASISVNLTTNQRTSTSAAGTTVNLLSTTKLQAKRAPGGSSTLKVYYTAIGV